MDWNLGRPALLRTGVAFDAVRIREPLVHAAVGSPHPERVSDELAEALDGPVIHDPAAWYYALVRAGTAGTWRSPLATVKGRDSWLAVPRVDRLGPIGVHWAVPPAPGRRLCQIEAVSMLLPAGQEKRGGLAPVTASIERRPAPAPLRPCSETPIPPVGELDSEQYAGRACYACGTSLWRGAEYGGWARGFAGVHNLDTEVWACPNGELA
ncbi:hypothetical protein [Streptomyces sp. NPDC051569]|uniref:hypothetical protein n=1 Tax=Streptomyces sp. NPDC051569 TaxID=3365661 RepID=UPI00378BFC71